MFLRARNRTITNITHFYLRLICIALFSIFIFNFAVTMINYNYISMKGVR